MSIRVYRFASELDGSADGKLFGSRFRLTLVALDKTCGKRKWAKTEYCVVATTLAGVTYGGYAIAEKIAKLSMGVVAKIEEVLGHYRNDEMPEVVESNLRTHGSIIVSNGCDTGHKVMTQKIFVPWLDETASKADLRDIATPIVALGATISLGKIEFTSDEKTSLAGWKLEEVVGVSMKEYIKNSNFALLPNNVGDGVDAVDPVLGEIDA